MDVIKITPLQAEMAADALREIARQNRGCGFDGIAAGQTVLAGKFDALAGKLRADKREALEFEHPRKEGEQEFIPAKGVQA